MIIPSQLSLLPRSRSKFLPPPLNTVPSNYPTDRPMVSLLLLQPFSQHTLLTALLQTLDLLHLHTQLISFKRTLNLL